MRAVIIKVVHVLADHGQRVRFVVDQHMVEALVAAAAAPAFDEAVHARRARWDLDCLDAVGAKT
jgi:hypothetical protein